MKNTAFQTSGQFDQVKFLTWLDHGRTVQDLKAFLTQDLRVPSKLVSSALKAALVEVIHVRTHSDL
jgi:hypothetical protein